MKVHHTNHAKFHHFYRTMNIFLVWYVTLLLTNLFNFKNTTVTCETFYFLSVILVLNISVPVHMDTCS